MCTYHGPLSGLFVTSGFLFHYVYLLQSTFWTVYDLRVSISLCVLTAVHFLDCLRPWGFYFTMCTYRGPLSGLLVTSGFVFHYVYFNIVAHCLVCLRPWGFYFTMCTYHGPLSDLVVISGFLFHYVYLLRSNLWTVGDIRVSISLCVLTTVHSLNYLQPQGFSPSMYHTASGLSVLGL